jgi:Tol biopolymer transport system component
MTVHHSPRAKMRCFGKLVPRLILLAGPLGLGACDTERAPLAPDEPSAIPGEAVKAPDRGRIVFVSTPGAIDLMNANGSSLTPVASTLDQPRDPRLSPDGTRIAFTAPVLVKSINAIRRHVLVMSNTGANPTDLTPTSAQMDSPTWSPDKPFIVYAESDGTIDGTLAFSPSSPTTQVSSAGLRTNGVIINGSDPSFSPDGQKIVFTRRGADAGVYVMTLDPNWVFNAEATAVTKLLGASGVVFRHPVFSPDGGKIVFSIADGGAPEIHVINADGSGLKRLTTSSAVDDHPSWSPDGRRIAFASDRTGKLQVWSMAASGGNLRQVTDLAGGATDPAFAR